MKEKELRKSLAVFPIGTVTKLTGLSARQIRYYEQQQLICPERNEGKHRLYSLNHVDQLLEIKDYLNDGYNVAAIKHLYEKQQLDKKKETTKEREVSDYELRRILHDELLFQSGLDAYDPNASIGPRL